MFRGTPSYVLAKELAALKLDLKKRDETEFGSFTVKKHQLSSNLIVLDVRGESHPLTVEEKLEQAKLRSEIEITLSDEIS